MLAPMIVSLFFVIMVVSAALMSAWWAFWVYPAWAWFVVPLGAPPISMWHFIALMSMLHMRVAQELKEKKASSTRYEWAGWLVGIIFGPIVTYGWFYFLHWMSGAR